MEISVLLFSTVRIGKYVHGNISFADFHGSNQRISPWKYPFYYFPRCESGNTSMEISISTFSTEQISKPGEGHSAYGDKVISHLGLSGKGSLDVCVSPCFSSNLINIGSSVKVHKVLNLDPGWKSAGADGSEG